MLYREFFCDKYDYKKDNFVNLYGHQFAVRPDAQSSSQGMTQGICMDIEFLVSTICKSLVTSVTRLKLREDCLMFPDSWFPGAELVLYPEIHQYIRFAKPETGSFLMRGYDKLAGVSYLIRQASSSRGVHTGCHHLARS